MKILIDIAHPADVNFYRNAILELRKEHEVVISVMDRGNLPAFVKRVLELKSFIRKIKPDVVTSFSYYLKNYP